MMLHRHIAPKKDIYIYDAGSGARDRIAHGLADLAAGLRMWRMWTTLGWRDFRQQNRLTVLGQLWPVIGLAITVGALGYVYGALLSMDPRVGYPYIAAGLTTWFFISGSVLGGFQVFVSSAGLLQERPLPLSTVAMRYLFRLFCEFCFKFTVFAVVALLLWFFPGASLVWLVPGLMLYFINGLWVILLFGVVGARFRDAPEIAAPLMLIAFLTTPVLWPPSLLQSSGFIATLNPFTHFIEIIREPLLGGAPSIAAWLVVITITVVGSGVALLAFAWARDRLVFWL